jgi:hypothetical protein
MLGRMISTLFQDGPRMLPKGRKVRLLNGFQTIPCLEISGEDEDLRDQSLGIAVIGNYWFSREELNKTFFELFGCGQAQKKRASFRGPAFALTRG